MLVPYTPLKDLSEEQKKHAAAAAALQHTNFGFVVVDGKVVNVNELNVQPKPTVRQKLFE